MATASAYHILVKTREEAEQLLAQLNKGADFNKLAKRHSLCPSKRRGGRSGRVS